MIYEYVSGTMKPMEVGSEYEQWSSSPSKATNN